MADGEGEPRLAWVPTACAAVVAGMGATALAGWISGALWLTSFGSRLATMKPNTALGFLLAGASLCLLTRREGDGAWRRLGRGAAWLVVALGTAALVQYASGRDWGVDTWGFAELRASAKPYPGRMALVTAICFMLGGLGLAGLDAKSRTMGRLALGGALLAGATGLLDLAGHLYGADVLYAVVPFSTMALPTALGLVLLAFGLLCARPGPGALQLLTSGGLGGMMLRALLPCVVVVPLVVGWLRLEGQRRGYYGLEFGLALFAVSTVLALGAVVWSGAVALSRIEARRQASARALAESERRARELVESLPLLVWTCRAEGPCDYLSPQWVRYTGVPEAGQLGYGWLERLHPEDRERTITRWKETAGRGRALDVEFRIRRHDGVYRWFKTRAEPLRDADGVIVKWFGTNTDIDEVKRGEEVTARLAALVESSDDAIIGKTLDGFVTSWNAGAERLFGYTAAEMAGQPIRKLIPSARHAEEDLILARIAKGEGACHFRGVRLRKNGGEIPVAVTVSLVRDASGRLLGVSTVLRDITEQLEAEASILRARDELEARVAERTRELADSNEALRRNTALLDEAQAIARLGSWSLDTATGEVRWSKQLFHIVGISPSSRPPNYHDQARMFAPPSWARLAAAIEHSVRTGEGYELELEVVRPDGERRWAVARAAAQRDENGRVSRLTGTFQDVTEIKRTREALDTGLLRMRLAADAAALGVWDWEVGSDTINWDETMRLFYGWTGPVSYAVWRDAVHPEDVAEAEAAIARAMRGEEEFDCVFRIRTAGGIRWMHGVAAVHRDASGAPARMVGVNRDVTAEQEAAQRLRASEALLREFVRHAPAAIAMLDGEMRYLQASERWLIDYKLEGREIIGRSHYEIFPDIPERWREIHRRVLAGAIDRCDEEPFPRADGSLDWLQWEVRPWRKADDGIGGLIMFTQVITERKRMELDLRRQKRELQRSNQELEQFAYVASHDLQEPLRAVTGCVQILQRRYAKTLDAKAGELIQHAVDGARRMQTLILDLLAFSRVGSGAPKRVPTELGAPLAEALANLRVAIEESGAVVTHDELPTLRVDRGQITQLLQNLVGNALKYRAPDRAPRIHVGATRTAEGWRISVADNGIGIEARYFERIFVIFQRLHTRGEYSGTGIGLAICRKIAEGHDGGIEVESTPGVGSTFHLLLPDVTDAP